MEGQPQQHWGLQLACKLCHKGNPFADPSSFLTFLVHGNTTFGFSMTFCKHCMIAVRSVLVGGRRLDSEAAQDGRGANKEGRTQQDAPTPPSRKALRLLLLLHAASSWL
jgi:hypothetical protein